MALIPSCSNGGRCLCLQPVQSSLETGVSKKLRPTSGKHTERVRGERHGDKSGLPPGSPPQSGQDDDWFEDFLTPQEIKQWAQRELRDASRALDLRARELIDLVTAYSAGDITPEKADELYARYQHRWGEALPGVVQGDIGDPPLTDERILTRMEERNPRQFITPRELHEKVQAARSGGGDPEGGKSR